MLVHGLITLAIAILAAASGFRPEYIAVAVLWGALTAAGPRARRFLSLAVPFVVVGVIYDKILPWVSQFRAEVHVGELYHAEKWLFGIRTAGGTELPSQWLGRHTSPVHDLACGFAYIAYLYETFAVAILEQYGLGPAHLEAAASAAGAARFDALLGVHYFQSFYARSHDVFGALPSLHVAYPILVVLAVWHAGRRWVRIAAIAFTALVAFAAVYLDHHYILDVIAGALVGALAYAIVVAAMRWRDHATLKVVESP